MEQVVETEWLVRGSVAMDYGAIEFRIHGMEFMREVWAEYEFEATVWCDDPESIDFVWEDLFAQITSGPEFTIYCGVDHFDLLVDPSELETYLKHHGFTPDSKFVRDFEITEYQNMSEESV